MVKLTGPLGSQEASGTVADVLVYSRSRGRAYARSHVVPKDPRTDSQIRHRLMIKFLSKQWASLPADAKLTWVAYAQGLALSPYHAFQKYNLDRFAAFHTPTMVHPADETWFNPVDRPLLAVGGQGVCTITLERHFSVCPWGFCVFRRAPPAYVPTMDTLVLVVLSPGPLTFDVIEDPVPPGRWRYMTFQFFSEGFHELNARASVTDVT